MKLFEVVTEEKVARVYFVRAESATEARKKFEGGEWERETPGEVIDCEVVDVVEAFATSACQ
jgi:hypothetical protein